MAATAQSIKWTSMYNHLGRQPMYLEFTGDQYHGDLRCTSIVRHEGSLYLRRTQLRNGKWQQFQDNGVDKMLLIFSCQQDPPYCVPRTFLYNEKLRRWITSDQDIWLSEVSEDDLFWFTQAFPFLEQK